MIFARKRRTFGYVTASALSMALFTACGDEDVFVSPSEPEGGAAGEPAAGGAPSDGGKAGSGGNPQAGTGGRPTDPPSGDAGAGGESVEPLPEDLGWSKSFALPGINGATTSTVRSVVATGVRKTWVAGEFSQAGDVPANNVAIWNGQRWTAVGEGLPLPVEQLAAAPEEKMYALVEAWNGEAPIRYWDGKRWSEVDVEVDDRIRAIDVAPDGTLYVAGYFKKLGELDAPGVAVRSPDGEWKTLPLAPEVLGDPAVDAIQVVDDGVCVAGVIYEEGIGVACFDGESWGSRTTNMTLGQVHTLEVAGGVLYAGGTFAIEGVDTGGGLAKWTGKDWELVGGGLVGEFGQPDVRAVAVDGAKVYATGYFMLAGGAFVRNIAMFNGTKWNDLNGGIQKFMGVDLIESPRGSALAVDDGGELYVGGRLTFAGAQNALRVARWDGADWHAVDDPQALRLGLNGFLNAVCAASDGSVYAGGGFEHLGGDALALGVARFVPADRRWYPLGAGLTDVATLVEHGGEIYAGGAFVSSGSAAGSSSVKGVGRWDGAAWRSVGGGVVGKVRRLFSGRDGLLYAGGNFTAAGAAEARSVAAWDGSAWSALGSIGDTEQFGDVVRAFAYDADGNLYAGGDFTTASDAPASNVVRWEDDAWVAVGEGLDGAVDSMALYDGKLVIGGAFSHRGEADLPHVAFWNPESEAFEPLGGGLPAPNDVTPVLIQEMAVHGTDLYVAGMIEMVGGKKAFHVARYDGERWTELDGGVDDVAESLSLGQGALWIGGSFTRAGGYGSIGIARYGLEP